MPPKMSYKRFIDGVSPLIQSLTVYIVTWSVSGNEMRSDTDDFDLDGLSMVVWWCHGVVIYTE